MHNAVADIILVHSMQGENWSPHEELYSKLFPEEQPAARVLIYGYDASLWRMTSAAGIEDAAKELLSELEGTSSKTGRPLIFICHSLGGIVAKKALLLAAADERSSIHQRTRGLMFLGAQHAAFSETLLESSSNVAYARKDKQLSYKWIDKQLLYTWTDKQLSYTWTDKHLSSSSSGCTSVTTIFERECSRSYEVAQFSYDGLPDKANRRVSCQECLWSSVSGIHMIGKNQSHCTLPEACSREFLGGRIKHFVNRITGRILKGQEACRTCFKRQEEIVRRYTSQRMPGTSNWIFNHPNYQAWLDSREVSCLWISGAAGSGKSTLCAAILDNLKKHQQSQPCTYISCFSATDNGPFDSARDVLRILICQLIEHQKPSNNVSTLLSLLDKLGRRLQRMSQASFRHHLRRIFVTLNTKQNITFVVDDFDNYEWIKSIFIDEIMQANLHRSKVGYIKCLVASRSSFVSTEDSNQLLSIDMSKEPGVYSDLFHYAIKNVKVLPSITIEHSHVLEVSRRLCHRADGIFLWVVLALEDLQGSSEPLETVENIPHGIEGIYEKRLRSIAPEDWPVAQKIISWLAVAYRSLSVSELSEAMVINNYNPSSLAPQAPDRTKDDQSFFETEIHRICGSLIRVTEEDIISFRHSSVQRYLLSGGGLVSSRYGAQNLYELVAKACLVLLGSDDLESFNLLSQDLYQTEAEIRHPAPGLFRYVATYWASHVRLIERKSRSVNTMLQNLFERALKRSCQRHPAPGIPWRSRTLKTCLLQLCAYHGFSALTQMYLETGVDPDDRSCTSCDTPLHIAATKGNTECVALLLKKGASIDGSTNDMGETSLHVACSNGSLGIAKMILRSKPDTCHITDLFGNTPLHSAAAFGNVEVVKLLLDHGADYNAITKATHETPLHLAAAHGHQQVVIALVDGRNAFSSVVDCYDSITQQPYFQTWSEDLMQDNNENGPFVWEADARDLADNEMRSLLVSSKQYADPSIRNYVGRTALQEAALHGHETVVRVLLDGDDAFAGGKQDQVCALQLAAEKGHLSVVRLLLKRGVYSASGSRRWGALIERVSNNGYEEVASLLMWQAFGSEVAGVAFKWPTVSLAMESRRPDVQELLHRKRMQREMRSSTAKRNGSGAGAGAGEKRASYRLPFRSRNS